MLFYLNYSLAMLSSDLYFSKSSLTMLLINPMLTKQHSKANMKIFKKINGPTYATLLPLIISLHLIKRCKKLGGKIFWNKRKFSWWQVFLKKMRESFGKISDFFTVTPLNGYCGQIFIIENPAPSLFRNHISLPSCQISEKSNERIPRKVNNRRTN